MGEVFRRIHAPGASRGRNHADLAAVLEDAHHVHGLDDLERTLLHLVEADEVVPAEGNDADLLAHGHLLDALLAGGHGLAGKVEGVAAAVHDDLDLVGVFELLDRLHVGHEIDHVDGRIIQHGLDGGVDHLGKHHGLVALDHDHDVDPFARGLLDLEHGLRGAGGAAGMGVSGHDAFQASALAVVLDDGVAGGDVGVGED